MQPVAAGKLRNVLVGISIDAVGVCRLPQVLAASGCRVTVVSGPGLAVLSSRHVDRHIATGRAPESVREGLEKHVEEFPDLYSWVLIADEPLLRVFLKHPAGPVLARLAPMTDDPLALARILSKVSFNQDAQKVGVPVPSFRVLTDENDRPRQSLRGAPTVAKMEESLSGSGVRVIKTEEEHEAAKAELTARPLMFQQYKPGRVGATGVLFNHGEPKCWFSYFLSHNWPHAYASSSALDIYWHPAIEPILTKIGKMTNFHGLCGIDWVMDDESGAPLVLELNPRPTPGIYAGHVAGVDFPRAIAEWMDGDPTIHRPSEKASSFHRMFPQNLFWSIDNHDAFEFFRTWQDAPISDSKLLASQFRRVATHYIPKSWRVALKGRLRGSSAGNPLHRGARA